MDNSDSPEPFPGLTFFEEMLPRVVALGTFELERYLASHRQLEWSGDDPTVLSLLEGIGESFAHVRFATGWSVPDVLHVIGCQKVGNHLTVDHLKLALRHIDRLAASVTEIAELSSNRVEIDGAFRAPPGQPSAPLRSMATESWSDVFGDARHFVADKLFQTDTVPAVDPALRRHLLDLHERHVG